MGTDNGGDWQPSTGALDDKGTVDWASAGDTIGDIVELETILMDQPSLSSGWGQTWRIRRGPEDGLALGEVVCVCWEMVDLRKRFGRRKRRRSLGQ